MNFMASWSEFFLLLLDFLIVWVILYQIIQFIRGTLLIQVMAGAGFLFVLYLFAQVMKLPTLKLLTHQIFDNSLLLMIIIFQDDLRRFLAKIGRLLMIRLNFNQANDLMIQEICKSIQELRRDRTGSIMVLEREIRLEKFYDHAIPIYGEVSSELILSIFQGFSPLHDGAVIIGDQKMICASAQLPLSQNPGLARNYGMRHSAGVGITEQTDAIALITSEETGELSLAVEGVLRVIGNLEDLRQILHFFFPTKENKTVDDQAAQEKILASSQMKKKSQQSVLDFPIEDLMVPEPFEKEDEKS